MWLREAFAHVACKSVKSLDFTGALFLDHLFIQECLWMKGWALRRLYGKQTVTRKRGETTQGDGWIFYLFICLFCTLFCWFLPEISCVGGSGCIYIFLKSLFSRVESRRMLFTHSFAKDGNLNTCAARHWFFPSITVSAASNASIYSVSSVAQQAHMHCLLPNNGAFIKDAAKTLNIWHVHSIKLQKTDVKYRLGVLV